MILQYCIIIFYNIHLLYYLSVIDTDKLRQILLLVHEILKQKQKTLQKLYTEDTADGSCQLPVCNSRHKDYACHAINFVDALMHM